jgi:hypothetical protein
MPRKRNAFSDSSFLASRFSGEIRNGRRWQRRELPDPKGQPMEKVRAIRDHVHEQVKGLLREQCGECCSVR